MDYASILDNLLVQIEQYSLLHRKSIQPFIRNKISGHFPNYLGDYNHEIIRESLLEHVGCLPVIASYLHPYMDQEVDLGKAMIMLSIHDIGELTVGDEITFVKAHEQGDEEYSAAIELLHPNYHRFYDEMSQLKTNEAKYVKSIDKIAPDIYDFLCGEEYSIKRVAMQTGWKEQDVIENIRNNKRPYMQWSSFLTELHDTLFNRFSGIKEK